MILTQDLTQYLNSLLTPEVFEDYCPNGLQIEGKQELKKIAFAVSATLDSLTRARDWNADALIVHHGVFWKHQGARTITGPHGERLKLAIKSDLNLYAFHLPLDGHPEIGNAASLAKLIGMKNLAPFGLYKKQATGIRGELQINMSVKEFKAHLEKILNHPVTVATQDEAATLSTLGIITGGANNEWADAHKAGLDAYLTGEISEYNWHDAREAGLHYFAGGHHATERYGIQSLMKKIKNDFSNLETLYLESENPA